MDHGDPTSERQHAADDLADRLKALADQLAASRTPTRVPYGQGRLGGLGKSRSPEGFVINPASLQMLLPDGRLWRFSRSDAFRHPNGRFYDPRRDHIDYVGVRTSTGGTPFSFLGAVLGKYSFGVAPLDGSNGLCALESDGALIRLSHPDDAFDHIRSAIAARDSVAED